MADMNQEQKQAWIVTGGNSGLGYQCARVLAADPDNLVIIACRDETKGEEAAAKLRRGRGAVKVLPLDLSAQASVKDFVQTFRSAGLPPLAGIVCNAGSQNVAEPTRTAEGYETTFGVNHLAHYLLTRLLLPDLKADGSIVFVSSGTHDPAAKTGMPAPRYQDATTVAADFEAGGAAGRRRYTTSKLCNIYNTYELARRLSQSSDPRERSIRVNAFDPGLMPGTGLARTYPAPLRFISKYVLPLLILFVPNVHRPAKSGERLAQLAQGINGKTTGKYFSNGREIKSSDLSYNKENAADLWNTSADMTGLSPPLIERHPEPQSVNG